MFFFLSCFSKHFWFQSGDTLKYFISLIILVYNISNKTSFENLDIWLKDVRSETNPETPIFIVGNNCDIEYDRKISLNEAKDFSLSNKAKYFTECSAKTGENVDNIFYEAAKYFYCSYKQLGQKNILSNELKIPSDSKIIGKNKIPSEITCKYILSKYSSF